MFDIDTALRTMVEREGSDLHVKVGSPPIARLHGELARISRASASSRPEDTEKAFHDIAAVRSLTEFEEDGEADFSYAIPDFARFRVNAFKQRGTISIVCRAIPFEIRSIEELGLPDVVRKLSEEQRGIILVTGTTGSGKSTTLAAMIDHINRTQARAHRHARGPDRVPAHRQALDSQPARSRLRHRQLRPCDAACPAPGPGRDPDRRDARRGDRAHGAVGGRDRPPRALDRPHAGRDGDGQPDHRLLPAPPAAAGAGDARLDPEGARSRSAWCPT